MKNEIRELVDGRHYAAMRAVVELAEADELDDRDIADLARGLAASGASLGADPQAADLASTGAPSSLSTLICPLHLRARGATVPKLGVRGRPAGGVDVLETIPGFRSALEQRGAEVALERSGYIHMLAGDRWVPLDARLFAYRQREGAQDIPALVIASILAKKLAAGAEVAGLEIRVAPHGNLGADFDAARRNAHRYNEVATLLGLRPVCVLTDAARPYQPYIGRGEALTALAAVLCGEPCQWLAEHHSLCLHVSDAVAHALGLDISQPPELAAMRRAHERMLLAHGAEPCAFWRRAEAIRTTQRRTVWADQPGWVEYHIRRLREVLVDRQRSHDYPSRRAPSDPAGVVLLARPGDHVGAGEPVLGVRDAEDQEEFALRVKACVQIHPTNRSSTPRGPEIIEATEAP